MVLKKSEIIKIIRESTSNLTDVSVLLFLLQKSKSPDLSQKFKITHLPIIGEDLKRPFLNLFEDKIKKLPAVDKDFRMFSDPEDSNFHVIIKKEILPELKAMIETIEFNDGLSRIEKFSDILVKSNIYCMEITSKSGGRIIAFGNLDQIHISNDDLISVKIYKEHLELSDPDVLILQKEIFAIYYPKAECLLMINYDKTKKLLDFKTQFTDKCNDILTNLADNDIIDIPQDNRTKIFTNQKINELAVKYEDGGSFKPTKEHFKKWNDFCENTPLDAVSKIKLNDQGMPTITNSNELANFLYVSNNDIMQGVVRPGEYARVISRINLNKK